MLRKILNWLFPTYYKYRGMSDDLKELFNQYPNASYMIMDEIENGQTDFTIQIGTEWYKVIVGPSITVSNV